MRMLPLAALAATAALCGVVFAISSATAQTQTPGCGPVQYSAAEQRYVGVPCNAPAQQTSDGKPCGPVQYSPAEQRYVGIPCHAPAQQTSDGKPCGPVQYSAAEQKYVGIPCTTK
jgi:hypothetical protein